MNNIEIIIGLLLLFMAVPDVCRRWGRPALVFPAYVVCGMALGLVANPGVKTMLHEAGVVGFLLLLFQVGLEIDLPPLRELAPAVRFAAPWVLAQYPLVLMLGNLMGFGWAESLFATAALTGVSVGMAYPAWKSFPNLDDKRRQALLQVLIVLEVLTIVLLAVEAPTLNKGLSWIVLPHLAGIFLVVLLVARFASQVTYLFQAILQRTTHWRTHLLVLLVLMVCAIGERLGLSATKTAFFLGLFMSRAEHDGKGLEDYIAPVSERFLIPIFFISLGLRVDWSITFSFVGLMAFGSAGLLLGAREIMHRRWPQAGNTPRTYLLLCPNLTIVALGASTLLEKKPNSASVAGWMLLTGLFMTLFAVVFLPSAPAPGTLGSSDDHLPLADGSPDKSESSAKLETVTTLPQPPR
jgi:Kef-type K+ transport system membrane component KefB